MQEPGRFDLRFYRGDSYTFRVRLWDDEPGGIPTDITGGQVAAEIRERFAGHKIVALDCAVTAPNIIDVTMTPAMWTGCPSRGVWDLQVRMSSEEVRTMLVGNFTSTGDVVDSTPAALTGRVTR